jgi:hypothetical protein
MHSTLMGQQKTIIRTVARAGRPSLREAEKPPYGRELRTELLRKARQLETASRINEWVSSPGLSSPK